MVENHDPNDPRDRGPISPSQSSAEGHGATSYGTSAGSSSRRENVEAHARDAARDVKDAAWQQAQSQYQEQRGIIAEQVEKLSSVLNRTADEFRDQNQSMFSNYTRTLADYSDTLAHRLRDKDLSEIIREAEALGRRRPALVVGGAVLTGFLLARFLRSSGRHDYSTPRVSGGSSRSNQRSGRHIERDRHSSHESGLDHQRAAHNPPAVGGPAYDTPGPQTQPRAEDTTPSHLTSSTTHNAPDEHGR